MLSAQKFIFMLVIDLMVAKPFARNFSSVVQHAQAQFIYFLSVTEADDKDLCSVRSACG